MNDSIDGTLLQSDWTLAQATILVLFKADHRYIFSSSAPERDVNLETILQEQLYPVPLSHATINGILQTASKLHLKDILTSADGICSKPFAGISLFLPVQF